FREEKEPEITRRRAPPSRGWRVVPALSARPVPWPLCRNVTTLQRCAGLMKHQVVTTKGHKGSLPRRTAYRPKLHVGITKLKSGAWYAASMGPHLHAGGTRLRRIRADGPHLVEATGNSRTILGDMQIRCASRRIQCLIGEGLVFMGTLPPH